MPERIQRRRTKGWRMPESAVYVGRGSKWGNPYPVGSMHPIDGETWAVLSAESSVNLYRTHLDERPYGRRALSAQAVAELAGKNLACWCAMDQPCHADVLLEVANRGAGT